MNKLADGMSRRDYPEHNENNVDIEKEIDNLLFPLYDLQDEESQSQRGKRGTELIELSYENPKTVNQEQTRQIVNAQVSAIDEEEKEEKENNNNQDILPEFSSDRFPDMGLAQRICEDFRDIMTYLEEQRLPADNTKARKIILESENYIITDGLLYRLYHPRNDRLKQLNPVQKLLCIPMAYKQELIDGYHKLNNHPGFQRLYNTIRSKYYLKDAYTTLYNAVINCETCQMSKINPRAKKAPLIPLPVPDLFQRIAIDLLVDFPETKEGFKHCLVVVEHLSGYPLIFPLKTQRSDEIAEHIFSVFCQWGAPTSILSDLGANLNSEIMHYLCTVFWDKTFEDFPVFRKI